MGLALDEPKEDEKPVQINGLDVLIKEFDMKVMDGTVLDYVRQEHGEGFVIGGGSSC